MPDQQKNRETQSIGLTDTFVAFKTTLERLVKTIVKQDDVEDIIGETYLRTYEHFGDKDIAYPKAYLYKTARNLALNHIDRHENRFTRSIEDIASSNVYLTSEELESQIEAQEKFRVFCAAIEKLPPKCSKAFVFKRVHGWSTKAIAKEMKISVSTVEKHVAKGLLLCANALEEKGYDLKGIADKTDSKNSIHRS